MQGVRHEQPAERISTMQGETTSEAAGSEGDLSLGQQALRAFQRDLPKLLEERPWQWVLYHGSERIGFAASDLDLYQEIRRRGFRMQDCVIRSIEEPLPDIVDSPYPFD
jgi:hypothetical protein